MSYYSMQKSIDNAVTAVEFLTVSFFLITYMVIPLLLVVNLLF